jgi:hypothetical protein
VRRERIVQAFGVGRIATEPDWLSHRHTRWPDTANPHLIINQQTAMETAPVSRVSLTESFRDQAATLERLRVHRQLDEALTQGPDPLHLAAMFGLDPKTAIRYAENARQPHRNITSSRTSLTSGGRAASIPAMAGMAPSHRAARRIGALFGQNPPTQTGTCGRCTGVGRKTTSSIVIWLPR